MDRKNQNEDFRLADAATGCITEPVSGLSGGFDMSRGQRHSGKKGSLKWRGKFWFRGLKRVC
jgi:hypothetical protein